MYKRQVGDNGLVVGSGSVYVYKKTSLNWVFQYKLMASDGADGDYFGRHIIDAGNQILISARGDDDNTGAVYAYEWSDDKWVELQKITASDGATDSYFGFGIDYDLGRLIIAGGGSGYLFEFHGQSWIETLKLTPSEVVGSSAAINIDGDLIIFGDAYNNTAASFGGAVYTFEYNNNLWQETNILYAEDTFGFGFYAYLDDEELMVADLSGKFFNYSRVNGKWDFNQIISPPDRNEFSIGDRFGSAIVFNDNRLVVGSRFVNDSRIGSVYIFDKIGGDWIFTNKLKPTSSNSDDFFGFSVSMQNQDVMVGAINDDDNGIDSGSAFIYQNVDDTIFNNGFE